MPFSFVAILTAKLGRDHNFLLALNHPVGHGHYGNKKKEAGDGWPPKGCSPPLALLKLLRCFSCPGAAQHRLATAGCKQTRAMPFSTMSLPSWPGSHKKRPGEEHGCQQSTARPARGDAGRSHPATQNKIKKFPRLG